MNAHTTLVLMACSATKRTTPAPAIDLYDGPLWQTLRTHRGELPVSHVAVLSGKYGFVNATTPIAPYEARLSPQKADQLIAAGVLAHNTRFGEIRPGRIPGLHALVEAQSHIGAGAYQAVIVVGSGEYRRVFDSFLAGFREFGLVEDAAPVTHVTGAIGMQRQQLGRLLQLANRSPATSSLAA